MTLCCGYKSTTHHPPLEEASFSIVYVIGYCLINVVARNNDKKREMVESVRQVFTPILVCQLKEDLNEVLLLPVKPQNYISGEYGGITKKMATLKTEAFLK